MCTLTNSEDPDEMHHCLLRLKQYSGIEMHHNLGNSTCDPFNYKMGSPIFVVSICMGKSIRIGRVNFNNGYISAWSAADILAGMFVDVANVANILYQSPLILVTLLHVDLINIAYLTACVFIRSSWRHTFWMTSSMTLNRHENRQLCHNR